MISDSQGIHSTKPVASQVAEAHRPAELIVLSVAFSVAIYLIIGLIIVNSAESEAESSRFRIPFFVAALFLSLGSIALRRTQLQWMRLQAVAGSKGVSGLLRHLSKFTIISAVIAEMIGLLALPMSFLGGSSTDVLVLGIIGLMVSLSSYPRRGAWEKAANYFASSAPDSAANR